MAYLWDRIGFHAFRERTRPALLFASPRKASERAFAGVRRGKYRKYKADRVLLFECDHRADELIGLKVDVSGEFTTDFELVFVQEP